MFACQAWSKKDAPPGELAGINRHGNQIGAVPLYSGFAACSLCTSSAGVELARLSGDDSEQQQWEISMAERDLSKDVDAIKSDLDALRKDLASIVETVKGTAKSRAESEIDALQKRLNQIATDVQSSGRDSLRAVEGQIGDKPLVSVAVAFAVGLVLGKLFDRR
jgi:ElaB/YqjD/DUF883 family membrane-anchored ribosome-binding protein